MDSLCLTLCPMDSGLVNHGLHGNLPPKPAHPTGFEPAISALTGR